MTWFYQILMNIRTSTDNEDFRLIFRNATFNCQPGDITILPTLIDQSFEKIELDIFTKLLLDHKSNTSFIDVGANIGIWSVLAGTILSEPSHIYAFEPDPKNLSRLRTNIQQNSIQNITVIPSAVAHDGKIQFLFSEYGAVSSINMNNLQDCSVVDSVKLDTHFENYDLSGQHLVIKIDVEGFEPTVIRGGLKTIIKYLPTLIIELDFSDKRTQMDRWGDEIQTLFKLYSHSYLVDRNELKRITMVNWVDISKLKHLSTLIFTSISIS